MCGIAALLSPSTDGSVGLSAATLQAAIASRGPDHAGCVTVDVSPSPWQLQLCASVLHIRGKEVFAQPACDDQGNVLLWNGEVFHTRGSFVVPPGENDTALVVAALREVRSDASALAAFLERGGLAALLKWVKRSVPASAFALQLILDAVRI